MPMTVLDDLAQPALWQAFAPDGVTPTGEISFTPDPARTGPGEATPAARVQASTQALGATLRRGIAAVDLTGFDELRLSIVGARPADGSLTAPFYLELRLASAAMGLADPANTWQRYLPVMRANAWDLVRLSLDDLPAAVRGGVTILQLRCVNAASAFSLSIDRLIAVRSAMIADVDAALMQLLNGTLTLGGNAIPAVLRIPGRPQTQARPYIEILQFDAQFSRERSDAAPGRGDYTDQGYALRPPPEAFELYYQVTAAADDRATQAAMLEFVLRSVPARGQLMVNGALLPTESVAVAPIDQLGGFRGDLIPLFYRVSARQDGGAVTRVQVPRNVRLVADLAA